jgi:hypothetical protein
MLRYYKDGFVLTHDQINLLIIGNVIAFIVALLAIKSFIGFLSKKVLKFWLYYRIAAGIILLIIHFHSSPDYHLMTDEDYLNGQILLIDKPLNWTSFQAVNKLKYALINKLGLPKNWPCRNFRSLATGLLLVCTGKFTKRNGTSRSNKEYTGTFFIGATTPSYDLETEIDETFPTSHIDESINS